MEERFIVTEIQRVIMVGKDEYPEMKTTFRPELWGNELIFHFSGHASVYFDDLVLEVKPNTIRFLPQGKWGRYEILRHEAGECIFVSFRADRVISPCAFVQQVSCIGMSQNVGTTLTRDAKSFEGLSDESVYIPFCQLLFFRG